MSGIYGVILGFLFMETVLIGSGGITKSWFGIEIHASLLDPIGALKVVALSSGIFLVAFLGLLLIIGAIDRFSGDVAFRTAYYIALLSEQISLEELGIFAFFGLILLIVAYTFAWILGILMFEVALVLGNLRFIFGIGGEKLRRAVQFMHGAVAAFFGFATFMVFLTATVSPYQGELTVWAGFLYSLVLAVTSAIIYAYLKQDSVKEYFKSV